MRKAREVGLPSILGGGKEGLRRFQMGSFSVSGTPKTRGAVSPKKISPLLARGSSKAGTHDIAPCTTQRAMLQVPGRHSKVGNVRPQTSTIGSEGRARSPVDFKFHQLYRVAQLFYYGTTFSNGDGQGLQCLHNSNYEGLAPLSKSLAIRPPSGWKRRRKARPARGIVCLWLHGRQERGKKQTTKSDPGMHAGPFYAPKHTVLRGEGGGCFFLAQMMPRK